MNTRPFMSVAQRTGSVVLFEARLTTVITVNRRRPHRSGSTGRPRAREGCSFFDQVVPGFLPPPVEPAESSG